MPEPISYFYLHGFASSPASRKARFLTAEFERMGACLEVPDLAEGNFEKLTISGQLEVIRRAVGSHRAVLIGSSLGGYLAGLFAARSRQIEKIVLLAPAFGFVNLWTAQLGPERLAAWQRDCVLPVFHYAALGSLLLGYEFLEDARRYEEFPKVFQPALIFHGVRDSVVPVGQSEAFVRENVNAELQMVSSDHELTDVLPGIWDGTRELLFGPS